MKLALRLALGTAFLLAVSANAAAPKVGTWLHFGKTYNAHTDATSALLEVGKWATDNCHSGDISSFLGLLVADAPAGDGSRNFDIDLDCRVGHSRVQWRTVRFSTAGKSALGALQRKKTVFLGETDMGGYFVFAITRDNHEMGDPPIPAN